ncbi:MAG TPA: hypothetical protein VHZ78_15990 [Rhizomicrobium sp.]|jgi:hypothetical protein|nr:hypothetical protein [Rhizomicrobium sp.]
MQYVCDAPGDKTWFRIETESEAVLESQAMRHALENHFALERQRAIANYRPPATLNNIERYIGLDAHVTRTMPRFLTLRDKQGTPLASAMLPPQATGSGHFRPTIVGPAYSDAYSAHDGAIAALEKCFGLSLRRECHNPFENMCQ